MKARRTRIAKLVADRALKGGVSKRFSRQVAAYLLSEGRVSELDSIVRDVQADWAEAGIVEVIASSAHPLTASIKADIKQQVRRVYPGAKRIIVTDAYDPDVIGGVRLNMPGKQLDLSVQAKLNQFKQLTTVTGSKERK
ncbi:MAG TPA: F0F1 ATP synthase subunit delta [Candidatus Saccharimonadales bacterium]|nr:F0F1 ATP synthase subunit delta [Candidatus Saccharimonadales bacterium]